MIMMALIEIQKRVSTGNTELSTFVFQHYCLHQKIAKYFVYISCAQSVAVTCFCISPDSGLGTTYPMIMKLVAVDQQNPEFSPGTPSFYKTLIFVLLLHVILLCFRIVRFCYEKMTDDKTNGRYSCFCGATLITSRHALTAFHCVDEDKNNLKGKDNYQCNKRDFSKGNF